MSYVPLYVRFKPHTDTVHVKKSRVTSPEQEIGESVPTSHKSHRSQKPDSQIVWCDERVSRKCSW